MNGGGYAGSVGSPFFLALPGHWRLVSTLPVLSVPALTHEIRYIPISKV